MTILPALLLVATVIALLAARKGNVIAQKLVLLLVLLSIVTFSVALWQRSRNTPARRMISDEESAGVVLGTRLNADNTAGKILVLRHPPLNRFPNEVTAARFAGLSIALKGKSLELLVAGPNHANLGSDDPAMPLFAPDNIDSEVHKWLAEHPDVKTVVSLLATTPSLPTDRTAYVFGDTRDPGWSAGLRNGTIKAAILYRPPPVPAGLTAETNDGLPPKFKLVTKDNLDAALKELSL